MGTRTLSHRDGTTPALTVAAAAGFVLWLRQRRTRRQQPAPDLAETVAQLRWRKALEADRDPETPQVISPR